jgi:hypothetical protein
VKEPPFPTTLVADIAHGTGDTEPWLVRSLWPAAAVGLLGGPPKVGKTWLSLDLALSVSSGTPCLGALAVDKPGPALLYLAEDSLHSARARIEGLCQHRGIGLHQADLHFITAPALRLDREEDSRRLHATVRAIRPRLLLLDPFVRLHAQDENDSGAVSAILASLRQLQRATEVAIVLVHHTRKNGRGPQGYALRGSGDLYAWGDAYAYLTRRDRTLRLSLEHRSHPPCEPLALRLVSRPDGSGTHLELAPEPTAATDNPLEDLVLSELSASQTALRRTHLRARLKVNNHRLGQALDALRAQGRARNDSTGWSVVR